MSLAEAVSQSDWAWH